MLPKGVVALVLVLVVAGCGTDDDEPAATGDVGSPAEQVTEAPSLVHTGSDASFYEPPDPLPDGEHGDLLRYQPLEGPDGAELYKVLYLSESVQGDPIAVSGLVGIPTAAGADLPVLSWAHGTTGLADECAPSREPLDVSAFVGPFVEQGWIVAATDYEGLGTPGLHPYLAGISEGRATLDIIRAAAELPDAGRGDDFVVWGHSQGGHGAMFAHQLAAEWTPELAHRGTVAGALPSELPLLAQALQGGAFQGYIAMVAGGLNAAYPEAELSLVMSEQGIAAMDVLEEACTSEVFEVFNVMPYEEVILGDFMQIEPWASVIRENDPGHVKVDVPLLIIHGEADEQIPVVASKLLFDRLCGLGQVVERRTYPGMGHAEVIQPSFPDMLRWMVERMAGEPAVSGCPTG